MICFHAITAISSRYQKTFFAISIISDFDPLLVRHPWTELGVRPLRKGMMEALAGRHFPKHVASPIVPKEYRMESVSLAADKAVALLLTQLHKSRQRCSRVDAA